MLWGSNYPDAPRVLISDSDLLALWGTGPRRFLFVPGDVHAHVAGLLGRRAYLLQEGLIKRTPRGRTATPAAYEHLGLPHPGTGEAPAPAGASLF